MVDRVESIRGSWTGGHVADGPVDDTGIRSIVERTGSRRRSLLATTLEHRRTAGPKDSRNGCTHDEDAVTATLVGRPAGPVARRLRRPAGWVILLVATPFLAAFYLLLPDSGPAHAIAYPVFGLIAMVAILVGVYRRRPARPGSWRLIALALALLSIADITYGVLALGGGEVAYPSVADIGYLAGYVALIGGTLGLIRGRVAGGDRTPIIDAAILSAGAGSIFWIAIIQPSLQGAVEPAVAGVSLAYPAMDVILLALGLRVLLTAAARPRYLQFLVSGIAFYFIADVVYALALLNGTYVEGQPVDAGWIVGVLLIGVAALHPSVSDPVTTVEPNDARLSRSRLALLAAAALVAPFILIAQTTPSGNSVVVGLVLQWTMLFGLVFVRLASTVDELGMSLLERRRLQGDLAHQAHHDPLTRLANRLLFELRLSRAMATSPGTTALIFLDLDDFKTINDTLGHAVGDELLRILAGRVQRGLRASDLAARLGGDEFAILLEDCDDLAAARAVAEHALARLRAPVTLGTLQLLVHGSAGVAVGLSGSTATDLMRDADIAMYEAKSHGKDMVEIYEPAMRSQVIRRYELGTEMAEALETGAFVLHYQAAVNLASGAIVGAEALVRWNHPKRGLLGPHEFIPHAESSGLIHALGRWILHEACTAAAGWPDRLDGERPAISVNLAASQLLDPALIDDVARILAETGLAPQKLVLEVTESALVDIELARAALLRLRGLGVGLALDDFGTGYSALSYIAELPFDIIKIDKSFVATIGQGKRVDALLDGIIGLCDALELVTVAEGIEDQRQFDRLVGLGCRIGQGFLFARPVPTADFAAMLAATYDRRRRSIGLGALPGLVGRPGATVAI
jgi:diguanylate cyclase